MRFYYILVKFNYEKYQSRKYHAMVDTRANITTAKYNIVPSEIQKKESLIRMSSAGKEVHLIELSTKQVLIQIGEYELRIPILYQYNDTTPDIILGMNFLE